MHAMSFLSFEEGNSAGIETAPKRLHFQVFSLLNLTGLSF